MTAGSGRWLRAVLRGALLCHPPAARRVYGNEVVEAAVARYRAHRSRGRREAWLFAARATTDVVVTGLTERRRGPVVVATPPSGAVLALREWWTEAVVALRALRKTPGFTAAAVAVLALGIGGNTAVFSALRATLLSSPPYPDARQLVLLDLTDSSTVRPDAPRAIPWSYPKYQVMAGLPDLPLESSAAYGQRALTLTGAGDATYLGSELVTPDYFRVLGVRPALGRSFIASDDTTGAGLAVILEHGMWRDRFGGDPGILGRSLTLNGRAVTVVGVAPPGFRGLGGRARLWVPVQTGAALISPVVLRPQAHWLRVVARIAPGSDLAVLDGRLVAAGRVVEEAHPSRDPTTVRGAAAQSLVAAMVNPDAKRSLFLLGGASLILLLVACANLAGLMGARALDRSREAAVRLALGAGRWRVARGYLAEALVLAVVGGGAAVVVAAWGVKGLAAVWPERFLDGSWNVQATAIGATGLDPLVLLFAGAATVLVGLLFGALPALTAGRSDPAHELRGGGIPSMGLARLVGVRNILVAGEIALAVVLLVSAGLMVRSLDQLGRVDRGFRDGNLVAFRYSIPRTSPLVERETRFGEEFVARLAALPTVESATLACIAPLGGHCMITGVRRAGGRVWTEGSRPGVGVQYVSDGFFATLGVPLLQGRTFTQADREDTPPVVVLSQSAAKRLFPDGGAVGSPMALGTDLTPELGPGVQQTGNEGTTAEVIGVVGDVLYSRPEQGVMPDVYISHRQEAGTGTVILRTRGEPLAAIPDARRVLAELAPDVPLFNVRTVDDWEAGVSADTRVLSLLLATFAALALVLACTGVWAMVAFSVARRTRELGLRVALGATPSSLVALVTRHGVVLALSGLALGSAAAWAASRLLEGMLYGVVPSDPLTYLAAGAVLLTVAVLAAWLPARRAGRLQPMQALRAE